MSAAPRLLLVLAAAAGPCAQAAPDAPPARDPFRRPALATVAKPAPAAPASRPAPPLEGALRATVVAGRASLADVDGQILRIGEDLRGYRLVEVREREAVFESRGKREVLSLD